MQSIAMEYIINYPPIKQNTKRQHKASGNAVISPGGDMAIGTDRSRGLFRATVPPIHAKGVNDLASAPPPPHTHTRETEATAGSANGNRLRCPLRYLLRCRPLHSPRVPIHAWSSIPTELHLQSVCPAENFSHNSYGLAQLSLNPGAKLVTPPAKLATFAEASSVLTRGGSNSTATQATGASSIDIKSMTGGCQSFR